MSPARAHFDAPSMLVLTRERRIDWSRMIGNLRKAGMSMQDIADGLDVGKATVYAYASEDLSTEPPFWVGSALLLLWAQRLQCKWTDAPTRRVLPSVSQVLRDTA
jgi:hypothetical protein